MSETPCYHCGLPVTAGSDFVVTIDNQPREMCCPGCQAVAIAIRDGGLEQFYRFRSSLSIRPESEQRTALEAYDLPEVQTEVAHDIADDHRQISLLVSGITCAACAWLIEHHLEKIPGVLTAHVNVTTHRASIEWQPSAVKLSRILSAFEAIGYQARPVSDEQAEAARKKENRRFLQRLGIAGLAMMQAGMIAVGLYAGAFQGIDPQWQSYLRWVSLVIASPVVLFSAYPFFSSAWRNLKLRHLTMDVPVSLAIGLAFAASAWATWTGTGEVYFDSVAMFTFFLLLGRYLEMRVRHRNELSAAGLGQLLPPVATILQGDTEKSVPVKSLQPGNCIRVGVGDTIPCDGIIVNGESSIVEAVLTGEYLPVHRQEGESVSAGTINSEHPLVIEVTAIGSKTRLSAVLHLVDRAQAEKPAQVVLADRVAGYFVAGVLLVSALVGYFWWQHQPEHALWVVLSVLVVTCPCALSLATPAALAVASAELRKRGFLINRGQALETLSGVNHVVFDKTGTLTQSAMSIASVTPLGDYPQQQLIAIAAALEQDSRHPIAQAFADIAVTVPASNVKHSVAQGISGEINGQQWAIGRADFVARQFSYPAVEPPELEAGQVALLLASQEALQAWIVLQDQLRPSAEKSIAQIRQSAGVSLLSGDRAAAVEAMAHRVGIDHWQGAMSPADKLAELVKLQSTGKRVAMVGDGINDVPVLSGADVSIAMGDATDLARIHADSILLSGNLETLVSALHIARRTRRIIRQNLSWALLYNLSALPLAAAGWVPPWAAAIGMSASSLLVVINALRLGKR